MAIRPVDASIASLYNRTVFLCYQGACVQLQDHIVKKIPSTRVNQFFSRQTTPPKECKYPYDARALILAKMRQWHTYAVISCRQPGFKQKFSKSKTVIIPNTQEIRLFVMWLHCRLDEIFMDRWQNEKNLLKQRCIDNGILKDDMKNLLRIFNQAAYEVMYNRSHYPGIILTLGNVLQKKKLSGSCTYKTLLTIVKEVFSPSFLRFIIDIITQARQRLITAKLLSPSPLPIKSTKAPPLRIVLSQFSSSSSQDSLIVKPTASASASVTASSSTSPYQTPSSHKGSVIKILPAMSILILKPTPIELENHILDLYNQNTSIGIVASLGELKKYIISSKRLISYLKNITIALKILTNKNIVNKKANLLTVHQSTIAEDKVRRNNGYGMRPKAKYYEGINRDKFRVFCYQGEFWQLTFNCPSRLNYKHNIAKTPHYSVAQKLSLSLTKFNTFNSTAHGVMGYGIFVVDRFGNFYISRAKWESKYLQRIFHSSFLAAEKTLFAGEIYIKNGRLIEITCHSGHYKPKKSDLDSFIDFLVDNKLIWGSIIVRARRHQAHHKSIVKSWILFRVDSAGNKSELLPYYKCKSADFDRLFPLLKNLSKEITSCDLIHHAHRQIYKDLFDRIASLFHPRFVSNMTISRVIEIWQAKNHYLIIPPEISFAIHKISQDFCNMRIGNISKSTKFEYYEKIPQLLKPTALPSSSASSSSSTQ